MTRLGAIAQLGERLAGSQKVEGSSPSSSIRHLYVFNTHLVLT